jgi:hypothetical protein
MIDLDNNVVDIKYFQAVLREVKNFDPTDINGRNQLLDAFSPNQYNAKKKLLTLLDEVGAIGRDSTVIIFGCWYGSILIPTLAPRVKKIIAIDLDAQVIRVAKNKFFQEFSNVVWITGDVFEKWRGQFSAATLFINTSCEHMPAMSEWPWWDKLDNDAYIAFTSNNMDYIDGHINCVSSIDEFKAQLPDNCIVLSESEIVEERGTKYTLVGKIIKP